MDADGLSSSTLTTASVRATLDRSRTALVRRAVAEVPAAVGDGRILFCQLDLQRHVFPDSAEYDRVAERILLNLLAR